LRTQKGCGDWSSAHVAMMLSVGRSGAHIAGLKGEDIDDCAAAFVGHLWKKRERIVAAEVPVEKEGTFLRRCAYRFAIS
jgi:hypothetical protein